jgi:hypothetical protein
LAAGKVCSSIEMGAPDASHLGPGDHGPKADRSRPRSVPVNALLASFSNGLRRTRFAGMQFDYLAGWWMAKKLSRALRRVVAEEHLLHPIRLRSFGGTARKKVFLIHKRRGFHVPPVPGDGLREFGAVVHCEIGSFARWRRQVRGIAQRCHAWCPFPQNCKTSVSTRRNSPWADLGKLEIGVTVLRFVSRFDQ